MKFYSSWATIPGPQYKDCGVFKFTDCTIKSDIRAKIEIIYE